MGTKPLIQLFNIFAVRLLYFWLSVIFLFIMKTGHVCENTNSVKCGVQLWLVKTSVLRGYTMFMVYRTVD